MVDLVGVGLALVFIGMGILVVASILSRTGDGQVKGGGVVLIGPIPVVFGSDAKWATVAILLAIVLIVLSLIVYRV
jgi:uncharacterized protein (TIGR00304 family)